MDCPKCKTPMRMQVEVFVDAPMSMNHRLPKRALRSGEVKVLGVAWDRMSWYCPKGDYAFSMLDAARRPPKETDTP